MSNQNVLLDLVTSKKAIVTSLGVIVVMVLCLMNKIPGESAVDAIKWLVSVWVGAQAFEDSHVKPATILQASKTDNVAQ